MSEHAEAPEGDDPSSSVRATRLHMEQVAADLINLAMELEDKTDSSSDDWLDGRLSLHAAGRLEHDRLA